jgi:hypothetical protein
MDNVSEVLVLRTVSKAGLEPPFGPRAKMAMVGKSVSIDGEPTHLLTHSVHRVVLTPIPVNEFTISNKKDN